MGPQAAAKELLRRRRRVALEILNELNYLGVRIKVVEGGTKVALTPESKLTDAMKAAVMKYKPQIISILTPRL